MITRKAGSHSQTSSALLALRVYGVQQREGALPAVASREVIQSQRPHHHSSKVVLLHVANLKKIIRALTAAEFAFAEHGQNHVTCLLYTSDAADES